MVTPEELTMMRIFVGESDRYENQPLYKKILTLLQKEQFTGATVLRGVAGFGVNFVLHTDKLLTLSQNLPLVIEVVDNENRLEAILPRLEEMIQGGLVTFEKVRAVRFGKGKLD